jgi:hypothetical protein
MGVDGLLDHLDPVGELSRRAGHRFDQQYDQHVFGDTKECDQLQVSQPLVVPFNDT